MFLKPLNIQCEILVIKIREALKVPTFHYTLLNKNYNWFLDFAKRWNHKSEHKSSYKQCWHKKKPDALILANMFFSACTWTFLLLIMFAPSFISLKIGIYVHHMGILLYLSFSVDALAWTSILLLIFLVFSRVGCWFILLGRSAFIWFHCWEKQYLLKRRE